MGTYSDIGATFCQNCLTEGVASCDSSTGLAFTWYSFPAPNPFRVNLKWYIVSSLVSLVIHYQEVLVLE